MLRSQKTNMVNLLLVIFAAVGCVQKKDVPEKSEITVKLDAAPSVNPHMDKQLKTRLEKQYKAILIDRDPSKFYDFFVRDCSININGVEFNDQAFLKRIQWLRENIKEVSVEVLDCFQSQDGKRMTDLHLSKAIDNKGVEHVVLVMQQSMLDKNGKINAFFDISRVLSEDKTTSVHTAK